MQVAKVTNTAYQNTQPKTSKIDKKVLAASLIGAGLTTGAVLYKAAKGGNFQLSKFHYSDKQLILIGAGSVLGGLIGGSISDKENMKYKYKEGLHQFFGNILAPIGVLTVSEKILDATKVLTKVKQPYSTIIKSAATIGSLVLGMHLGNSLVSKFTDKLFHEKDNHKIKIEDYSVHTDDLCMAISHIGKGSLISRIAVHCLPFAFLLSGYKTGAAKPEEK
ncbi:hypothetical protein IKQ26_06135 [bacterium]|nr:hypothetical protein [bacterium]